MLQSLSWSNKMMMTHIGNRVLQVATIYHPDGTPFELINVESLFSDVNKSWLRQTAEVTGCAVHHDAVAFSGKDVDFDGHTTDEEFARLNAIWKYHVNANNERPRQDTWNGIGYHAMGSLENRIYIPRIDVLNTHRAHVSGGPAGQPSWNRQLLGYCFMGHYSDNRDPSGKTVAPLQDRPPEIAIKGMDAFFRLATNLINKPLTLKPHKAYQNKECPGTWTTKESWSTFKYEPEKKVDPPKDYDKLIDQHAQAARREVEAIEKLLAGKKG